MLHYFGVYHDNFGIFYNSYGAELPQENLKENKTIWKKVFFKDTVITFLLYIQITCWMSGS